MADHALQKKPVDASATPAVVRTERADVPTIASPVPVPGLAVRRRSSGSDPLGGTAATSDVTEALRRRKGKGSPLPADVSSDFSAAYGADLSDVRVHTDSEAAGIASSVQSVAFTHGSDIYFSKGSYSPTSPSGQHLLGHELAHAAQYKTGMDSGGGSTTIGRADDPLESHADSMAASAIGAMRRKRH